MAMMILYSQPENEIIYFFLVTLHSNKPVPGKRERRRAKEGECELESERARAGRRVARESVRVKPNTSYLLKQRGVARGHVGEAALHERANQWRGSDAGHGCKYTDSRAEITAKDHSCIRASRAFAEGVDLLHSMSPTTGVTIHVFLLRRLRTVSLQSFYDPGAISSRKYSDLNGAPPT